MDAYVVRNGEIHCLLPHGGSIPVLELIDAEVLVDMMNFAIRKGFRVDDPKTKAKAKDKDKAGTADTRKKPRRRLAHKPSGKVCKWCGDPEYLAEGGSGQSVCSRCSTNYAKGYAEKLRSLYPGKPLSEIRQLSTKDQRLAAGKNGVRLRDTEAAKALTGLRSSRVTRSAKG